MCSAIRNSLCRARVLSGNDAALCAPRAFMSIQDNLSASLKFNKLIRLDLNLLIFCVRGSQFDGHFDGVPMGDGSPSPTLDLGPWNGTSYLGALGAMTAVIR